MGAAAAHRACSGSACLTQSDVWIWLTDDMRVAVGDVSNNLPANLQDAHYFWHGPDVRDTDQKAVVVNARVYDLAVAQLAFDTGRREVLQERVQHCYDASATNLERCALTDNMHGINVLSVSLRRPNSLKLAVLTID
jgi:hypothetical protein